MEVGLEVEGRSGVVEQTRGEGGVVVGKGAGVASDALRTHLECLEHPFGGVAQPRPELAELLDVQLLLSADAVAHVLRQQRLFCAGRVVSSTVVS